MNDEHTEGERPLPADLDPRGGATATRAGRGRGTPTWVKVVRILSAVLSTLLLAGTAYGVSLVNRSTSSSGTLADTAGKGNSDRLGNAEDINILVVGNDSRKGYTKEQLDKVSSAPEESLATDTIMLIHVPANGTKIRVVSFPRDSYVDIPGYDKNKINAAYVNGYTLGVPDGASEQDRRKAGQQTLISTVSKLSGMKIDHYVEVTLLGFYDLTNALGGIQVNLCQPAQDSYSGASFPAGKQTLNGQQALSFVRQRHGLPNGDLDRIKRQQYFFGAVIRKVLDQGLLDLVNISKLTSIIDALSGTVSYDANLDPIQLAEQMSNIAAGNVEFVTLPLAPNPEQTIGGKDVLQIADQKTLDAFFGGLSSDGGRASATTSAAPKTVDPKSVTLDVYNGTKTSGAAAKAAEELKGKGFTVENVLSAATSDYPTSVVQYPAGMADQAATVAAAVPGATTEESTQVHKVSLIVGANYPGLGGGAPTTTAAAPAPTQSNKPSTAADEGCIN
ncbi:LCP family protein [Cumulibacter manganitolerans]|uniref:LCP family protein n=1 Tax=Cumulibacter manganitolerans TaxID=1884992 RepID=UPI0012977AFA|nr:LCP family protein [Cumulibacter manganitolerans]